MTGSPWPVSLYQIRTPLILASGIAFLRCCADWLAFDSVQRRQQSSLVRAGL